jgi:hypothetical protein
MNPSINEFESMIIENNVDIDISIENITKSIKLLLGEFNGLLELFNNLDNTIDILCNNIEEETSYNKLELASDDKTLLGIFFKCKTNFTNKNCFISKCSSYQTIFHFTILSATTSNEQQTIQLNEHFNIKFNEFTNTLGEKFKNYTERNKLNKKIKKYRNSNSIPNNCLTKNKFIPIQNNVICNYNTDLYYNGYYDDSVFYDAVYTSKKFDIKKKIIKIINKVNNNDDIFNIIENSNNIEYNSNQEKQLKNILSNLKFNSYYI